MIKKSYVAEFIGTFVLVLVGCGAAVFGGGQLLATAMAFGLAVIAMAYVIGNISGCHINPAITIGAWINKGIDTKDATMYIAAQMAGALTAAITMWFIEVLGGIPGSAMNFGANVCGGFIAGKAYVGFFVEVIFTCLFVLIALAATDKKKGIGNLAGLVIGLSLIMIHIVVIPMTGTSVNPARTFGPGLMALAQGQPGMTAFAQMWLFIPATVIGGGLAGLLWKVLSADEKPKPVRPTPPAPMPTNQPYNPTMMQQ
ncbi:MAG: aquaporin [Muribaculaceae bacterium]|nr:aquaporin [Muribaculaceae bacterium]